MPQRPGEENTRAVLTAEQVREIRRLHRSGGWQQVQLAQRFKVHKSTIGQIVRGRSWKHVND